MEEEYFYYSSVSFAWENNVYVLRGANESTEDTTEHFKEDLENLDKASVLVWKFMILRTRRLFFVNFLSIL